ncbi:MAG: Swt1 family HEPN domain-containing protein, partial [bacterium]
MAITNHERIGKALELLNAGMLPFVEREMKSVFKKKWLDAVRDGIRADRIGDVRGDVVKWDTQAILAVLWNHWNDVFKRTLGHAERSLVSELREVRNRWAHQDTFSTDDAYRALDSIHRLLSAVTALEANEVDQLKQQLLRTRFDEQARSQVRRAAAVAIEGSPKAGLKPWREIATPHDDVASGRYQQAEFAADLAQVYRAEGAAEYSDPQEFFRRTFLTDGLRDLLTDSLLRLSGKGGNPVIKLQTNFGGGKTHSMIALFHLFSGAEPTSLAGVEQIMEQVGISAIPASRRAVLVGTAQGAASIRTTKDGTEIRTLWGEMAWQLLGKEGYNIVADADKHGVSPGSDALRKLFSAAAPCMILIDEWIAYVRMLYGKDDLPAGSFDANLTFAQSLTEAARATKGVQVVASIPSSDIEIGGEAGKEALTRLENTFARMESPWRPAGAEESFEIVRRRLFKPIEDLVSRDAVVRKFSELYGEQSQEFPAGCKETSYKRRMESAYPIHPELFDRLYEDWSSLEKFQRTRGVLRLMAAVIHALWERNDSSLVILPSMVALDDDNVSKELLRYLDGPWSAVLEKDIDGPNSLPLRLDQENPNLGRYSANRRVARAIFVGSAPTVGSANKGIEDRHIKLACAQPGESPAVFGDALRRLTDQATHLYVDKSRYWYSLQPSVTRLAQDRAQQFSKDEVHEEIKRRLRKQGQRGDFARVHACPESSADIVNDTDSRLVIFGPESFHTAKDEQSPAMKFAQEILENRGTVPRSYKNTLVFLAADKRPLQDLESSVRIYLAWSSISS